MIDAKMLRQSAELAIREAEKFPDNSPEQQALAAEAMRSLRAAEQMESVDRSNGRKGPVWVETIIWHVWRRWRR